VPLSWGILACLATRSSESEENGRAPGVTGEGGNGRCSGLGVLFGAGLQTPPTPFRGPGRTAGLPMGSGLESFARRSDKVRRPCHNLVLGFRGFPYFTI